MIDRKAVEKVSNIFKLYGRNYDNLEAAIEAYEEIKNEHNKPVEQVARALWDFENGGRKNQILDVEWSLLKNDYLKKAAAAMAAMENKL